MDEHGGVENAKDNVRLPLDVLERGRHEVAEGEVEDPVCRGRERDGLAPYAERVELRGVDPADGAPGGCVASDEEVGACDETLGRRTSDGPRCFGGVVHALRSGVVAVGFEEPGVGKHEGHHTEGTEEESGSTAPAVHVEQSGYSHDDVDNVLNRGRHQKIVACQASHGENVGYVVHFQI